MLGRALTLIVLVTVAWGMPSKTAFAQMAPVSVGLTSDAESVTVGDVLTLTLTVNHPRDHHVVFPDVPREWGRVRSAKDYIPPN